MTTSSLSTFSEYGKNAFMFAVIFFVVLTVSVLLDKLPIEVIWFYLAASIITFLFYAFDKSAAQRGQWRTPENTLHLLALTGGWPGAFAAQKWLCHKSKKQPFLIIYWVCVVINCVVFVWLLFSFVL